MAILWLFLGFLSVVGSSSPDTSTVLTTISDVATTANPPTSVAASSQLVTNPPTTVKTVSAFANTVSSKIETPSATTAAPLASTVIAPPQAAPTTLPVGISTVPVTSSSESPPTATTQTTTMVKVITTIQNSASTAGNSITTTLGLSKHPEGTVTTGPTQLSNTTTAGSKNTDSSIVHEILTAEPSKGTTIGSPALSSSASPLPKTTASTITGGIPEMSITTSAIPQLPGGSSAVPVTAVELSTPKDTESQEITEPNRVQVPKHNIEVKCTNITNTTPYVKINIKGSAFCDTNGKRTDDGHAAEHVHAITMHVCKALKPGYQETQDKCIIQLARFNEEQVAITDAIIESHLEPKDLFKQLKRSGASLSQFSFDGGDTEDEDVVSIPLISAIVSLAVVLLIIAAAYGCWQQRKARKREQRLTEELQTMENGYHDNPTLEVMETSPEMQEKKGGPNGEIGDSWIVPLDNLTREDLEEEEDTHL